MITVNIISIVDNSDDIQLYNMDKLIIDHFKVNHSWLRLLFNSVFASQACERRNVYMAEFVNTPLVLITGNVYFHMLYTGDET